MDENPYKSPESNLGGERPEWPVLPRRAARLILYLLAVILGLISVLFLAVGAILPFANFQRFYFRYTLENWVPGLILAAVAAPFIWVGKKISR